MTLLDDLLGLRDQLSPPRDVEAHCDIPCGIYDPHYAQVAALTVVRMFQLMEAANPPDQSSSKEDVEAYLNSMARYVMVKEEHAQLCKKEVLILWTDYFKPEHLQQYSNLHDLVWNTTKLCSTVKQQVNMEAAQQLLGNVQQIAEIFWATKGVQTRRISSHQTAGGEFVVPA